MFLSRPDLPSQLLFFLLVLVLVHWGILAIFFSVPHGSVRFISLVSREVPSVPRTVVIVFLSLVSREAR